MDYALIVLALAVAAQWYHSHRARMVLQAKVDQLQGVPVIKKVVGGKRIVCPICDTSYSFAHLKITKTSPRDKTLVQCVCNAMIDVSFDANGDAQCQV